MKNLLQITDMAAQQVIHNDDALLKELLKAVNEEGTQVKYMFHAKDEEHG